MKETEGVIKYQLNHTDKAICIKISITELNSWRTIIHRLGLIGQKTDLYDGYGYGNISQRIFQNDPRFIISGTQTGHIDFLSSDEYCLILDADPYQNKITSEGPCKPSSEALTHAMVYLQHQDIQCIIHAHSPEIWNHTEALDLPCTAKDVAYGTPEMAIAVKQLFQSGQLNHTSLFTMQGHQDGVIAFGTTIQKAAEEIIHILAQAISIENESIAR